MERTCVKCEETFRFDASDPWDSVEVWFGNHVAKCDGLRRCNIVRCNIAGIPCQRRGDGTFLCDPPAEGRES